MTTTTEMIEQEFVPFAGLNYAAFRNLCEKGIPAQLASHIVRETLWEKDVFAISEEKAGNIVKAAKAFVSKEGIFYREYRKDQDSLEHQFDGEKCSCGGNSDDLLHAVLGHLLSCWRKHEKVSFGPVFMRKLIKE